MKHLLVDLLRRRVWLLVMAWLGCFTMALTIRKEAWAMMTVWGMFAGPLILVFEQQKGVARTIVTLPVRIRAQANLWFAVATGIPALVILTAGLLGAAIGAAWRHDPGLQLGPALLTALFTSFWCGGMTWLISRRHPRTLTETGWRQQLAGLLWGAAWGCTQLVAQHLPTTAAGFTPVWVGAFVTLGVLSWRGWKRMPTLFEARRGDGVDLERSQKVLSASTRPDVGNPSATGLVLMLRLWAKETLLVGVFILIASFGTRLLIASRSPGTSALLHSLNTPGDVGMSLFMGLAGTFGMTSSLRTWRCLPLTSWQLARIIVLTAWLPMLGYWPMVTLIHVAVGTQVPIELYWKLALISGSLLQFSTVVGCLLDSIQGRFLVLILPAIFLQTGSIGRPDMLLGRLDWILGLGVPPLVLGTLWLLHWALTHRSNLYKPLPLPTPSRQ